MRKPVNKILIVDDDEEICEEVSQILKDEGYNVTVAHNGLDGKRLMETNKYRLAILDIKMPGMNGFDLLKSIKEQGITSKIIMVTGSFMIDKLLKEGNIPEEGHNPTLLKLADCLISKPFDIEALLQRVKEFTS